MRAKKLLAAFLLGVSLCFVPALGYGEILGWMDVTKESLMDSYLFEARSSYMMCNPTSCLNVSFYYDPDELYGKHLKQAKLLDWRCDTKDKIVIVVTDNRGVFSGKFGTTLKEEFKRQLEITYPFIRVVATDVREDIVASFLSEEGGLLGYFDGGYYFLLEK